MSLRSASRSGSLLAAKINTLTCHSPDNALAHGTTAWLAGAAANVRRSAATLGLVTVDWASTVSGALAHRLNSRKALARVRLKKWRLGVMGGCLFEVLGWAELGL